MCQAVQLSAHCFIMVVHRTVTSQQCPVMTEIRMNTRYENTIEKNPLIVVEVQKGCGLRRRSIVLMWLLRLDGHDACGCGCALCLWIIDKAVNTCFQYTHGPRTTSCQLPAVQFTDRNRSSKVQVRTDVRSPSKQPPAPRTTRAHAPRDARAPPFRIEPPPQN